jgi:hypothetical protein
VPDGEVPEAPLVPVSLDVPVAPLELGDDMLELLPLSPDVPMLPDDDESVPVVPDVPELPLPMLPGAVVVSELPLLPGAVVVSELPLLPAPVVPVISLLPLVVPLLPLDGAVMPVALPEP